MMYETSGNYRTETMRLIIRCGSEGVKGKQLLLVIGYLFRSITAHRPLHGYIAREENVIFLSTQDFVFVLIKSIQTPK